MENADTASMKDGAVIPDGTADSKVGMSKRQNVKKNFQARAFGKGPINEADADDDAPDSGNSSNGDHKNDLYNQAERILKHDEKTPMAFPCQNIGRIIKLLQNEKASGDHYRDEQASGCCSKKQVMEFCLDEAISPVGENNAIKDGILSRLMESDQAGNLGISFSEKLESTDENDVGEADSQNAGGVAVRFAASESSSEVKSEVIHLARNQSSNLIPVGSHSHKKSGVLQSHWEDKERALFNASADKRLSRGKTHSHASVESCNSAMVVKKRCRFDRQLFVGSKKAKQIHNQPLSSSCNGQDSTFMNWISNVIKGLSRPTLEAGAPLSSAFSGPCNGPEEVVHAHMSEKNMGHTSFKTFFESIYLPSQNHPEVGLSLTVNEARSASLPTGRLNKVCTTGHGPAPCHEGIDNVGKQLLPLNKELNDDTSEFRAGPSSLPSGVDGRVAVYALESEACLGKDKDSVGKNGLFTSGSSLLVHKKMKAKLTEENSPQSGFQGDSGSLLMRRFSPKAHLSLLKGNEATEGHGNAIYGSHNSRPTSIQSPQSCGLKNNPGNAAGNGSHGQKLVRAAEKEPTCHVGIGSSVGCAGIESGLEEEDVRKADVMSPPDCLKSYE